MKERDKNYNILISPIFIFDIDKRFKSFFAPWIYAFLKLDYLFYLQKKPNTFYRIERKALTDFFSIDKSNVSRALKQLIDNRLLEKKGGEYRLLNDEKVFPYEKRSEDSPYPDYIMINNNFFINFIRILKESFEGLNDQPRALLKAVEVFYYLIARNHHVMTNIPKMKSNETVKSISKALNHDEGFVRGYLGMLQTIGYIEYDIDENLYTNYEYGICEPFEKTKKDYVLKKNNERILENIVHEDKNRITEKPKIEPISERERIGYILAIGGGNAEKTEDLLKKFKISQEAWEKYLAEY